MVLKKGKGKYCSQLCANRVKGRAISKNKILKQNGYIYLKTWEHPNRSKQNLIAEHRVVVEQAIGRYLTKKEAIHHIDGNKTNNVLSNLFLCKNDIEHRIVENLDPAFLRMFNLARYEHWEDFGDFDITKDRQDQLQDMVELKPKEGRARVLALMEMLNGWQATHTISYFDSMEQLWLAFLLAEKYGKYWDGSNWVLQK